MDGRPLSIAYALMEFPALTETFVSTECDLLERRGHHVVPFTVRAPSAGAPLPSHWLRRTTRLRSSAGALTELSIRAPSRVRAALGFIADQSRMSPSEGAFAARALPLAADLAVQCLRDDVDTIHTHFERGAAIVAGLGGILAGLPWSFTAHAFGVYLSEPRALAQRLRLAAFVRASHAALATTLRAVEPSANVITAFTPIDVEALPARVEALPARVEAGSDGPVSTAVVIARDVPKKGLDLLPSLGALLARRGISVRFDVIGPSPRRGADRAGPLPHAATLARLAAARFTVLPCRIAPNGDRDGIPLCLIEALAIGVPAFSTRVGGIPELFTGPLAAHLAAPEDVVGLADAIVHAVADRSRLETLVTAARDDTRRRFGPGALAPLEAALRTHR